ncbi:GSCFA family [Candidatus Ornithobacterium hominis]|uniref:GSCFA family n=1 Tax=Candidatus Ornithobacterium hominis TaxID=2497989 RepID=A0A383U272_9FLAO|nr:GSCFA domain-containing protein [Candidatus Ornithobacterium hominis]MCT7904646.1 GSCFA domain-containing protein [Candidatus Ornithobacterium hominis]SZD73670.1 GSCFA family [Candidatus Ornithobacterium hominis]SZD74012.1 GSCFA family [Candidatus Ornithobacterium hominis]
MQLFTEVSCKTPPFQLSHRDKILLMGSCFSTEVGEKLQKSKFPVLVNPFGTLFHPWAVETALSRIYTLQFYTENEIFHYQDLYFSWDHSTLFSRPKLTETLTNINEKLEIAHEHTQQSHAFVFTLGTAWVYELKKAKITVGNCHKVPSSQFHKFLMSPAEIFKALKNCVEICLDLNPEAKIIFTISPVRHWRDGAHDNQLSKSSLFLGLEKVLEDYPQAVYYFPSYEIILDELRDYRYFKSDLLHPNETAINFVWEKFSHLFFSSETLNLNQKVETLNQAMAHRPRNPNTLAHRKFLYDTLKKAEKLSINFPKGSFDEEIKILKEKIHHVY